jgi:hypothetical protein
MVLNFEQLSDENLVNFYKKELKMIDLGEPASTFFSESERRRLIKKGILRRSRARVKSRMHARSIWITTISDMARTLISQAER